MRSLRFLKCWRRPSRTGRQAQPARRRTARPELEGLEDRRLLSATLVSRALPAPPVQIPALLAAVHPAKPPVQAQAADRIFNVDVGLGSGLLNSVLNLTSEIRSMEKAIDAVLAEVPGWHLTANLERTPKLSAHVGGMIDEAANGTLKGASLSLIVSANASASIEGWYGYSLVHIGFGVTVDLSAKVSASASYSPGRGWIFGGRAELSASVKGFAEATLPGWKAEVYAQGSLNSSLFITTTGMVSGNASLSGTVGADLQRYDPQRKKWITVLDASYSLSPFPLPGYTVNTVSLFHSAVSSAVPNGQLLL